MGVNSSDVGNVTLVVEEGSLKVAAGRMCSEALHFSLKLDERCSVPHPCILEVDSGDYTLLWDGGS